MRILKRFENYIKENLENQPEDLFEDELEGDLEGKFEGEFDEMPEDSLEMEDMEEEVPEEEEYEYIGNKLLNDLATALGTKVVNNQVEYNGKKINFYSETNKFHVDKKKFDTVEDVLNYLEVSEPELEEMPMESLRNKRFLRSKRTK